MKNFVHLHNHSQYSVLDGTIEFKKLIKKLKKFDMNAFAITDHGNMFGVMDFHSSFQDSGIKPIYGAELYIAPNNMYEKDKNEKYYHIVLLAKNNIGFQNLIKLTSLGYTDGFYYKPRIDKYALKEHCEGLIALTACVGGELQSHIINNNESELYQSLYWYIDTFGKENFFLEIQNHGLDDEHKVINRFIDLSRETGVELVATNDCHYLEQEDANYQEILLAVSTKKTLSDESRMKFPNSEFYVKSSEEMHSIFKDLPQALENTQKIADMCNVEIEFGDHLPLYSVPPSFNTNTYLKHLCQEKIKTKFDNFTDEYQKRLSHELQLIEQMGFSNYFLVVQDFVQWAKKHNIIVGPGRGSVGGSLVAYVLGITNIDPIKYKLLFERFLNPERVSMPDIDIDFQDDRRDEVKEYLRIKYGYDKTANIITFYYMKPRAALTDVGRVLELPIPSVKKVTKLIDNKMATEDMDSIIAQVPELQKLIESKDETQRKWIEYSKQINGTIRQTGVHASGMVISDTTLTDICPLFKDNHGEIATQWDYRYLEDNGLIKMDLLGLNTLTHIKEILERIYKNSRTKIDIDNLPLDDKKTFKLLQQGKTLGVFQVESEGMQNMLIRLKPDKFEDIIAALALYRPGPLGSGMVDDYVERKHGRKQIEYSIKELEPILKETYGLCIYQEQIMFIARDVCGFSMGQADILRKGVGKKNIETLQKMKTQFISGGVKNDHDKKQIEKIWEEILKFAQYGFNRSHSCGYAMITYITAYLKAHYPVEFMSALLSQNMSDSDKMYMYIQECKELNIPILPIDINKSEWSFKDNGKKIRYGFGIIKRVGETFANAIIQERNMGGNYSSIQEFIERISNATKFNRKTVEYLLKSGAMDSIIQDKVREKKYVIENLKNIVTDWNKYRRKKKKAEEKRKKEDVQYSLFKEPPQEETIYKMYELDNSYKITPQDEFLYEIESLGFYFSQKIFIALQSKYGNIVNFQQKYTEYLEAGTRILVWGYIKDVKRKVASNNKPYFMINFSNTRDDYVLFVFENRFKEEEVTKMTQKNQFMFAQLEISFRGGFTGYNLVSMKQINQFGSHHFTEFHIFMDDDDRNMSPEKDIEVEKTLKKVVETSTGHIAVYLHTVREGFAHTIQLKSQIGIDKNVISILEASPHIKAWWYY